MKKAKSALFVAAGLSFLLALEEITNFLSLEIILRQYRVLDFQDVNFVGASETIARFHLIKGGWLLAITALISFAIFSIGKSN